MTDTPTVFNFLGLAAVMWGALRLLGRIGVWVQSMNYTALQSGGTPWLQTPLPGGGVVRYRVNRPGDDGGTAGTLCIEFDFAGPMPPDAMEHGNAIAHAYKRAYVSGRVDEHMAAYPDTVTVPTPGGGTYGNATTRRGPAGVGCTYVVMRGGKRE